MNDFFARIFGLKGSNPMTVKTQHLNPAVGLVQLGDKKFCPGPCPSILKDGCDPPPQFNVQVNAAGNAFTVYGENGTNPAIDMCNAAKLDPAPTTSKAEIATLGEPDGMTCGFTPVGIGTTTFTIPVRANDNCWAFTIQCKVSVVVDDTRATGFAAAFDKPVVV